MEGREGMGMEGREGVRERKDIPYIMFVAVGFTDHAEQ